MATVDFSIEDLKKIFLTKADAKQFATKEDISSLKNDVSSLKGDVSALKDDVKALPTKADVKQLLEKSEFRIVKAVSESFEAYDERYNERFTRIEEKLGIL